MHLDGFSGDRLSLHDASNFGMVALFHRQLAEFKRRRRKRLSRSGKMPVIRPRSATMRVAGGRFLFW